MFDRFKSLRTYKNETTYKNYKHLFEKLKFKSKQSYYKNLIFKNKNNIKKTWAIINEVINKTNMKKNYLPRSLIVNNKTIYDKKLIAENFNDFFVNIGPKLAAKIEPATQNFNTYLHDYNQILLESELTDKEFENAFFSLKINKSAGYDDVNYNCNSFVMTYVGVKCLPRHCSVLRDTRTRGTT